MTERSAGWSGRLRLAMAGLVVVAAAACSTIKLGYESLPTLITWQADSYLDLDDHQEGLVKRHANALLNWHRHDQLPVYAGLLGRVADEMRPGLTVGQVAAWRTEALAAWGPIAERLAPAVAEVGVGLRPVQVEHLKRALAKENDKLARTARSPDPEKRVQARVKRWTERAESFFGDVTSEQRALIKAAAVSTVDDDAWWQQRLARQQAMVGLLAGLAADRPSHEVATARAREVLGGLFRSMNDAGGEQLTVALVGAASPEQLRNAAQRLSGYRSDVRVLASC